MASRRVLVAGASGVVGLAALRHFSAQPDVDVAGIARRPRQVHGATVHALDLTDRDACAAAVAEEFGDVTHLVYCALYEKPGLVPGWQEHDQMQRNLHMFANLLDPLVARAPLDHVTLLQGTKAYGAHVEAMTLPGVERSPRHQHDNFYWLQEDHLRDAQSRSSFAHTIFRPQIIFGESFASPMNPIPAFGVYAAVLRHDGRPLDYPGEATFLTEAVDADLLAEAIGWATTAETARDETFNITNGDVFTMENVWPAVADAFGMEVGERRPAALSVEMPERAETWRAIVRRFDLVSPADIDAFVGQSFIYADLITGFGQRRDPPPTMLSTIKIRKAGFGGCVDTEHMFRRLIASMQDQRFLPPRNW